MFKMIKKNIGHNILLSMIRFLINYIKYFFLTCSVIFSLTILLFIMLNINPNSSLDFLKYFSFINPILKTGNFSLGIKEIMQIFSIVSFVLMVIIGLIRTVLKKMFHLDISLKLKSKKLLFFVIITFSYLFASVIIAFSNTLDTGLYGVFGIYYIFNLVSLVFYFMFDALLRWFNAY